MTGFVAVFSPDDAGQLLADLQTNIKPDGSTLRVVRAEAGFALFATDDLPSIGDDRRIAVGDISLPDPDALMRTLKEQRSLGLAALMRGYESEKTVPAGFAEDYHFVVWDADERSLVAGRDGLGVRPLFYAEAGERFIVASAMRMMLGAGASQALDGESIARFMGGRFPASGRTYYHGASRLAPGARLIKRFGEDVSLCDCEPPIAPPAPWAGGDPVARFRSAFVTAVRDRLSSSAETGALLSGGLDSSSIAIVAAELYAAHGASPPKSISMTFDATPRWSERDYILDVKNATGLEGPLVDGTNEKPFRCIRDYLQIHGGPFLAPGLSTGGKLYSLSEAEGLKVLLDGHGGDEVVSYGFGRMHSEAAAGRWTKVWSLTRGLASSRLARAKITALYWMKYGWGRRLVARAIRAKRDIARRLSFKQRPSDGLQFVAEAWRPCVAEATGSAPASLSGANTESAQHFALVAAPQQPAAMETLHAAASAAGIAPRYPFWDRDLLELCLSLPETAKLNDKGLARWVLRQAIELPPSVRGRYDKLDFSPHLALGLIDGEGPWFEELIERRPEAPVWRFASRSGAARALQALRRHRENASGDIIQGLWRVGVLSIWLDEREARGLDQSPQGAAA